MPNKKTPPSKWLVIIVIFVAFAGLLITLLIIVKSKQSKDKKNIFPSGPKTSLPDPRPGFACKALDTNLIGLEYCKKEKGLDNYIQGLNGFLIEHVGGYTVSPNNQWLFVVKYSDYFAESGGAPAENALALVNLKDNSITELFSQIYFPNYEDPQSWINDGNGIVFTAGAPSQPAMFEDADFFAVVYCDTVCQVLAKDAGPIGVGGDPAYFEGHFVRYTGKNGEPKSIPFVH